MSLVNPLPSGEQTGVPAPADAPPAGAGDAAMLPASRPGSRGCAPSWRHPAVWVFGLLLLLTLALGRTLLAHGREAPALRLPLPAFELRNERGEPFGLAKLRGRVWVADFVFTSCTTVCPKLTRRMVEIQDRSRHLGDAFRLVTFTVDPENDTPEVLAAYAAANKALPERWTFLTGELGDVERTVVQGFKIAMGKETGPDGILGIFHGERLVLVDREGLVRGYYEADDAGLDLLLGDVESLVRSR